MQKKYTNVQGIKLAYVEKNSHENKCIFFIHGNSGSSLTWSKQLESPLFSDFRIVAFDLPAHGSSESSPNPDIDYSPIMLGKIMAQAVRSLAGDQSYILAGFSFGTNVIGEMLFYDLRPAGIIIVSSCVISSVSDLQKVFLPNPNTGSLFIDSFSREAIEKLAVDCFFLQHNTELEKFKSDFENTTTPFRSILMKKASEGAVSDEIDSLRKTGLPILTIFGNEDKLVDINYLDSVPFIIWQKTIYKLPGAGHFVHVDQPDRCNLLIFDYAIEMFITSHA